MTTVMHGSTSVVTHGRATATTALVMVKVIPITGRSWWSGPGAG
ncbi:MAG TPA: hypothetical protein VFZ73_18555 [Gemmatimonadaceae bacterium]